MSELPLRKNNRLKGYDYSCNGCYFITICVKDRQCLLSEITGETVCLSKYGIIVDKHIMHTNDVYTYFHIDNYVIMPNHIHFIINVDCTSSINNEAKHPTISQFISVFKQLIHKECGFNLWQRNFHDHIIRNDEEYNLINDYIIQNPLKWQNDCFY